jgi:Ankyrin repeats (many copies)
VPRAFRLAGDLSDDRTAALASLFRSISSGEDTHVAGLLRASPDLARAQIAIGASRADAPGWFVADAGRYIVAGDTALHFAAASYRPTLCKKMLALGADVRAKNRRRMEPLHAASVGAPGSRRWNPRMQVATISLLIDAGADPNCTDADGAAPIHLAVRTRCAAAVQALLERGANPRAKNKSGSTPLHLAVQTTGRGGSGTDAARAQQESIIQLLMEHGARTSDKDGHGKTVAQRSRRASLPFIARLAT